MRTAILALVSLAPCHGAIVSLDLGKVYHAVKTAHGGVPASVKWRRATAAIAGAATIGDTVTTHRGIARGGCELNPVLRASDGCGVNTARFTALKAVTLGWLFVGEELAHKLPHGAIWDRENTMLNVGAAALYTGISIRNELQ